MSALSCDGRLLVLVLALGCGSREPATTSVISGGASGAGGGSGGSESPSDFLGGDAGTGGTATSGGGAAGAGGANAGAGGTSATAGASGSAGGGSLGLLESPCAEAVTSQISALPEGTLVDARDGKHYRTVQIGAQLWMAQNLDYGTRVAASAGQVDDTRVEKFCAGDCDSACETLGGLYTWAEAMARPSQCNTQTCTSVSATGICPAGYHLPTVEEFTELETTVEAMVGQYYGGNALRSTQGWEPGDLQPDGNGTDSYSFRVLPAGIYSPQLSGYFEQGSLASYWLATNAGNGVSTLRRFRSGQRNIEQDSGTKTQAYSVRCLAD